MLTDVEMPGMTGIELLEALRRLAPQLPVAVITAHASVATPSARCADRADEFLQKSLPPGPAAGQT